MQGKELDLSIVTSPKEISQSIRRNLHFIRVAKLLHLSILECLTIKNKGKYVKYIFVKCLVAFQ